MATQREGVEEAQGIENRDEIVREESEATHRDPAEFPSSEDFSKAVGESGEKIDVPGPNERVSDSETPDKPLHGSLHGNWTAPKETV
jgi:hypothetical protein